MSKLGIDEKNIPNVVVNRTTHNKIGYLADERNISKQELVREILEKLMQKKGKLIDIEI